ncbi:MAG: dolichyl-phosphate-mannose-protein mannosyltransferase [Amphiamblys sp. WSBS2006]|nr:MAG: dolichyl-phosphate-mannose-protein mannosyltransferase [Amphiamblys sp. WSBS2006]
MKMRGDSLEMSKKQTAFWALFFSAGGILTRFYRIGVGARTIWDEAHFGKFGSYYIKRQFYTDVHPPLGKMLIGLIGYLFGYNGRFEFGSGDLFRKDVPYVQMRMAVALFGALTVPIAFLTAVELGYSLTASVLVGALTMLDNGFVAIERILLLDPIMLFFITLSTLFFAAFTNKKTKTGSPRWFGTLLGTGVAIGCSASVKWVGFFVVAMVGILTIYQLWMLAEKRKTAPLLFAKHFGARAFCLIAVPAFIYVLSFVFHIAILMRTGPGDASMSSMFQANLIGNPLSEMPREVGYGSIVTMRPAHSGGGLLHSHVQTYPTGTFGQQVTTYGHKDTNNNWMLYPETGDSTENLLPAKKIKHGDTVRLLHVATGRFLQTSPFPAPLSGNKMEVSCKNSPAKSDGDDMWVVEMVSGGEELAGLETTFRLRHRTTGWLLESSGKRLPEWGFSQGEIVCDKDRNAKRKNSLWNIEDNFDPRAKKKEGGKQKTNFWKDFCDLNVSMFNTNNALVPDSELEPCVLTTKPSQWMFLHKGIRMSGWDDSMPKFYMLGNPIVWWLSGAAVFATAALLLGYTAMRKHGVLAETASNAFFIRAAPFCLLAWGMHFFPFFVLGRVLYLHHYFPCLFYAILCLGLLFDHLLPPKQNIRLTAMSAILAVATSAFIRFSPMCYGIEGPAKVFAEGRKWRESWNL